ncbi:MAG TPA: L-carnitine dehydrogenase [Methylomirabilota bacterium]|nr:L-carnitine dehydrogenase [Methylomirabilota bacterium]
MPEAGSRPIKTVGIVGGGVIGGGWAARALAHGLDVVASDPAPGAEAALRASIANAWPALTRIGLKAGADQKRLTFVKTVGEVGAKADFIQESAPERIDLKRKLHAQIDAAAAPDVIIASSSSGLLPSEFQADCKHPERVIVGHPFNPVYLLPLVEVLGGKKTGAAAIDHAATFYTAIGMRALKVRTEVPGYIADRLQEALWREILHLVNDGVATTGEIDDAIRYGPGLRWAFMGTNLIYHLAGGEGGMKHMLEQFGPALELPWTNHKAPKLTQALIDRMVEGTGEQAKGWTIKELERFRDDCIIRVLGAVEDARKAAGGKAPV